MPTALIVGASRGLGRALAEEHVARGWSVVATVRDPAAMHPRDRLEVERLDVTDRAGIDTLAGRLAGRSLDLLFVNAGVSGDRHAAIGAVAPEEWAALMLTNALAPMRVIEALGGLVPAGGTIAVMSSGLGSVAGNTSGGWEAYRMSKAALDMGFRSLAARDRDRRTWLAVAPGWIRTDMGGEGATYSVEESIPLLADMLEARAGTGGCRFVDRNNKEVPW